MQNLDVLSQEKNAVCDDTRREKAYRSQADLQHELILLAFSDSLRYSGFPREWLGCEVRQQGRLEVQSNIQIRITMRTRNGHVLRHALALQQDIVQRLNRYQPKVDASLYDWVWKYSDTCQVSASAMPSAQDSAHGLAAFVKQKKSVSAFNVSRSSAGLPQFTVGAKSDGQALRSLFSHL